MSSDLEALREVLAELEEPLFANWPLERQIRSWIAFVATVEVEYDGEWEEYTAELSVRDYLDEICRRLPGYWADYITDRIGIWDSRFLRATSPETKAHLPPLKGDPGWWQFRTPLRWSRSDPRGE